MPASQNIFLKYLPKLFHKALKSFGKPNDEYIMRVREIHSKIYGNLGRFKVISPGFYQSESNRVYLLGEGDIGGKGEGLVFLDKICDRLHFQIPAPTIIICNDFFGLPKMPLMGEHTVPEFTAEKINEIVAIANMVGMPKELCCRSSATVEDQLGQTAAGIFESLMINGDFSHKCYGKIYIQDLALKFHQVAASVIGNNSLAYHEVRRINVLTPLAMVFQPLVGSYWLTDYDNELFGPHLAGIMNTATPGLVKVSTVLGLGETSVGPSGAGLLTACGYKGEVKETCWGNPSQYTFFHEGQSKHILPKVDISFRMSGYDLLVHHDVTAREALVPLAVAIQGDMGCPLDFEWAWVKDKPVYLLQVRPLASKLASFPKPDVDAKDKILDVKWVVGQGELNIQNVIIVDQRQNCYFDDLIQRTAKRYPHNLLLLLRDKQKIGDDLEYCNLAWSDAVVLADYRSGRMHGSGLQHLALNIQDEGKIMFYTEGDTLRKALTSRGRLVEELSDKMNEGANIIVYNLVNPVKVVADDENDWGMVYQ